MNKLTEIGSNALAGVLEGVAQIPGIKDALDALKGKDSHSPLASHIVLGEIADRRIVEHGIHRGDRRIDNSGEVNKPGRVPGVN